MDRAIKITVPQYGAPKVEAIGFNGDGCTEATAMFERALTTEAVATREFKPEWSNPAGETEQEEQGLSW